MLQTIVYTSQVKLTAGAKLSMKPKWLDSLVMRSAVKNKACDISGVISYKNGKIIQLIEGEPAQLKSLYAEIKNDNRHQDVITLLDIMGSQRIFSDWGMVLEPNMESSALFRDFLHTHINHLVDMSASQSDELIYFIDHIFYEITQEYKQHQGKKGFIH